MNIFIKNIENSDFKNAACKQMALLMASQMDYADLNKKGDWWNSIWNALGELYPSDRGLLVMIYSSREELQKAVIKKPKLHHGGKRPDNKTIKNQRSYGDDDCDGCGDDGIQVITSSGQKVAPGTRTKVLQRKTISFESVEDVLERFENNPIAMKAFATANGITLHVNASKPETIAKSIHQHFVDLAEAEDAQMEKIKEGVRKLTNGGNDNDGDDPDGKED